MAVQDTQVASDRPRRIQIVATCLAAVVCGLAAKFYAFGMVMCFGVVLYPIFGLGHVWVHLAVAHARVRVPPFVVRWCLVSDAVFVVAMLLQIDQSDWIYWLTITHIYGSMVAGDPMAGALPGRGGGANYGAEYFDWWYVLSYGAIALVCGTWVPLLRFRRRLRNLAVAGICPECGYALGADSICPECGARPEGDLAPTSGAG